MTLITNSVSRKLMYNSNFSDLTVSVNTHFTMFNLMTIKNLNNTNILFTNKNSFCK